MEASSPTVGNCVETDKAAAVTSDPEQNLTELTRCLTDTYTARARIRLDRGEFDLGIADLNEVLRLAPDNDEARRFLEHLRDQPVPAMPGSGIGESGDLTGKIGRNPLQGRFRAGYLVSARYDAEDNGSDQVLEDFPLTPGGFLEAVKYARHMCSDESSRERGLLYDAYLTGGEAFDAVVTEFRSIVRQVHLVKALDDDGQPLID